MIKIFFILIIHKFFGIIIAQIDNIGKYEIIYEYSVKYQKTKRDIGKSNYHMLEFQKFGSRQAIKLYPDFSIFTHDFNIVSIGKDGTNQSISNYSPLFRGKTKNTDVYVVFDREYAPQALFHSSTSDYYLEPAWRYIPTITNHSVLIGYEAGATSTKSTNSFLHLRKPVHPRNLTVQTNLSQTLDQIILPPILTEEFLPRTLKTSATRKVERSVEDLAQVLGAGIAGPRLARPFKKFGADKVGREKTRCPLLLVADWRFYRGIGNSDMHNTINYLIGVVGRMNAIFTTTRFRSRDRDRTLTGYGFVIRKIVIHRGPTDHVTTKSGVPEHYNARFGMWTVAKFLESFSYHRPFLATPQRSTIPDVCLAHLFTHQPFKNNVLGLAYVASDRFHRPGGICTRPYYLPDLGPDSRSGSFRSVPIFLNTGFSSYQNEAFRTVFTQEADIITAHELGHNWGSEHDDPSAKSRCNGHRGTTSDAYDDAGKDPDNNEGNGANRDGSYIMFPFSLRGYEPNNRRFSPCSISAIGSVLGAKADTCFVEPVGLSARDPTDSFCGNSVVEFGEECDAGWSLNANSSTSNEAHDDSSFGGFEISPSSSGDTCCDNNCKLRPGARCSDRNGPCCQLCQFASSDKKCRNTTFSENPLVDNQCLGDSTCTGVSDRCGPLVHLPRSTRCHDGSGFCSGSGTCMSHCEYHGLRSCICSRADLTCKLCCKEDGDRSKCEPYTDDNTTVVPITLREGQPCHYGYCGSDGTCQREFSDSIQKIWNYIENIDINAFGKLIRDNLVGTIVIISAFLWIPASVAINLLDQKRDEELKRFRDWVDPKSKALIPQGATTRIKPVDPNIVRKYRSGQRNRLSNGRHNFNRMEFVF